MMGGPAATMAEQPKGKVEAILVDLRDLEQAVGEIEGVARFLTGEEQESGPRPVVAPMGAPVAQMATAVLLAQLPGILNVMRGRLMRSAEMLHKGLR